MERRSFFGLVAAAFVAPVVSVKALLERRSWWFNKPAGLTYRSASPGDHQRLLDAMKGTCDDQLFVQTDDTSYRIYTNAPCRFVGEDDPLPPLFGTHADWEPPDGG